MSLVLVQLVACEDRRFPRDDLFRLLQMGDPNSFRGVNLTEADVELFRNLVLSREKFDVWPRPYQKKLIISNFNLQTFISLSLKCNKIILRN